IATDTDIRKPPWVGKKYKDYDPRSDTKEIEAQIAEEFSKLLPLCTEGPSLAVGRLAHLVSPSCKYVNE
ncbi:MAG: hypothetical protein BJ554DRAFT_5934, partial [Olpidium bornovanus]